MSMMHGPTHIEPGYLLKKFSHAICVRGFIQDTNVCEYMSKIYIKNMVAKYYFQQRPMESNRTRRYKCRNKKNTNLDGSVTH